MPNHPTVSVLLPVYNGQRHLRAAVDSILNQTFKDFELIAVDDGSTDDSGEILRDYAQCDPRVHIISRPNTGIAGALNDAIAAAKGTFLARMDADDVSLPQRFEKQVAFLQAHPEVVLLGSRAMLIDPYDSPLYESNQKTSHEDIAADLMTGEGWAVLHPTAMMRAETVWQAGGYRADRIPTEDLDLYLRLTEKGRAANLPDVLLHYRQHLDSANHTRSKEQNRLRRQILLEAHARRGIALPADWKPSTRQMLPVEREVNMWAWLALKKGNVAAARRHAFSLMKIAPFSMDSWRLMFCALRGH